MSTAHPKLIHFGEPLRAHLAAKHLATVYIVTSAAPPDRPAYGQAPATADPWALQAATRVIETAALAGGDVSLDHVRVDYLDGDHQGTGVHQVIAAEARSMSLFGGRRVVTVLHTETLGWGGAGATGKRRRKKTDIAADPLEAIIDSVERDARAPYVLIFVAGVVDRRNAAWKQVLAKGIEIAVPPLDAEALQRYLETVAKPYDIRVHRAVAQEIWDRLGPSDPARLRQTADRLLLDVGPRGHLTQSHVEAVVPIDRDAAVFKITDAMANEDLPRAFAVLHLLMTHGTQSPAIVGFLASHYRALMQVGAGRGAGLSEAQLATASGQHPYRVKLLCQQLGRFRTGRIELAVISLSQADSILKSSGLGDPQVASTRWMEQLLIALARGQRLRVSQPASISRSL